MNEQDSYISPDEFVKKMGEKLAQLRYERELTQEVVAHLAGITVGTYARLEKGISSPTKPANPRLDTLLALAKVFNVEPYELLQFDDLA